MKNAHNEKTCALCNRSLRWWNAQACSHCGRTICDQHSHVTRQLYSSVLVSRCVDCAPQRTVAADEAKMPFDAKHQLVHI